MILTSKQKNYLTSAIRRITMWNPEAAAALKSAKVGPNKYKCANCFEIFKKEEINRDHIDPIVPMTGFPMLPDGHHDWNMYIQRAIISRDKYQILCIPCHDIKTAIEDKIREQTSGEKTRKRNKTKKKKNLTKKK